MDNAQEIEFSKKLEHLKRGKIIRFASGDDVKSFYYFARIHGDRLPDGRYVSCKMDGDSYDDFLVSIEQVEKQQVHLCFPDDGSIHCGDCDKILTDVNGNRLEDCRVDNGVRCFDCHEVYHGK